MRLSFETTLLDDQSYQVNILSTAIKESGEAEVVQFLGSLKVTVEKPLFGSPGDGDGEFRSPSHDSTWTADFISNELDDCPLDSIPPGVSFAVDVNTVHRYEGDELLGVIKQFHVETNIVSMTAQVEAEDGDTWMLEPETDIFTPSVDYITYFRFGANNEGDPTSGAPYSFTLIDAFGNPISGAVNSDVWTVCPANHPRNPVALLSSEDEPDIELSWDDFPIGDGWQPDQGMGFYQIQLVDMTTNETLYGSELQLNEHRIPWDDFGGETPGMPDGFDYGQSLEQLPDGSYIIRVDVFTHPLDPAGHPTECILQDQLDEVRFQKSGTTITIQE